MSLWPQCHFNGIYTLCHHPLQVVIIQIVINSLWKFVNCFHCSNNWDDAILFGSVERKLAVVSIIPASQSGGQVSLNHGYRGKFVGLLIFQVGREPYYPWWCISRRVWHHWLSVNDRGNVWKIYNDFICYLFGLCVHWIFLRKHNWELIFWWVQVKQN